MELPKHILAATDLSDDSMAAITTAAALANASGGRVTMVHVFDPTPMVPPIAIPAPERVEASIAREMEDRIREEMDKLRESLLATVKDVEIVTVRDPNPAHAICQRALDDDADLVIIGTHGRTGLRHLLIGSVAERVVRHAPCPVLVIRDKGEGSRDG